MVMLTFAGIMEGFGGIFVFIVYLLGCIQEAVTVPSGSSCSLIKCACQRIHVSHRVYLVATTMDTLI